MIKKIQHQLLSPEKKTKKGFTRQSRERSVNRDYICSSSNENSEHSKLESSHFHLVKVLAGKKVISVN